MSTIAALLRLGRPPRGRIALSVTLGSVTALAGVGLMALAGYLISRAAEHPPVLSLTVAIVAVRAFGVGKPIARYFERLESHDLAFRVLARMRVASYRKLEPLIPSRTERYRQGDLLARLVGDVDATQHLFLRGISPPLVAAITGIVSVGVVAAFLPAAAIVLAAGFLLGGVAVPIVAVRAGRRTGERQAEVRAALTTELVEILRGAPELVVLGADEAATTRVRRLDAELTELSRRDAAAGGLVEGLSTLVSGMTVVGVLAVCVGAAGAGVLDRVLIAALALLTMASFEAVTPLPATALGLHATLEAGRRLLSIVEREPEVADPPQPATVGPAPAAALEAAEVDPADEEEWGLRGVDLRLAPGSRVALTGPSGAGKSTVAALLVRFLDPDGGRVTLDGEDLRVLRRRDVRARVSLDAQDAYLFATSIRENVRIGDPAADDAAIEGALRRACIWDWVAALPAGLDTHVGEEGALVSGGERRRIALARTLLADPPVTVLDEPTAHLDPEMAERVVTEVMAPGAGSVLLITHRDEGLTAADEVVTLRSGRVTA